MKRLFKYIFLFPLLLVVSCIYDEGLSIEDVLKVSDNTFEFTAAGDEIEFTIESYCGWVIKCEADWVSFSDYEGESKDVKNVLTVSENLSVNARTVQAEIINDRYGINIKLNISQEAGAPYIKTSSERLEFEEEGGVAEIKVESNVSWEASVDVDWISITPKSGVSGVCTMTINVNKNTSLDSRSSVIRIVNSEYNIEQEILVTQSELVPELKVNVEKLENISYNGSSEEVRIESNVPWEASVDVDWIELSPQSGESGVTTMTINIDRNVSVDSRSAVISVENSEYGIEEEILVVQSEFVPMLRVNREKIEDVSEEGSIEEIRIESNVPWEASVDVDWIELSPQSGESGVTTMTINIDRNVSVDRRSAVVSIVNSEYEIKEEILVVQSEFVPELKVNLEKLENISYNGSIEEVRIESNISWEASFDVDWIEISPKSGESGVCTMTIVVGENVLEESREGIITLKNKEYSLTVYVKIQQNKWVPNINGYEYVDLGLPSGLKWATCNVGADSPEDYGDYYAWGEIETKSEYTEDNSKTYGKSMSDISGNAMYDVARAKWGGNWRMPTMEELEELNSKCTWQWTTQKGINGYKVTGPNGNSIFIPAAGCRTGSSLNSAGGSGFYWSSTPYESEGDDNNACELGFYSSNHNVYRMYRDYGLSVRPVSE